MADDEVLANAPDAIRNPIQIRSLLGKLVKQRSILSVTLDGFRRQATSAVLSVDQPEGYLVLDELVPNRMHERVRPGSRLAVYTRLDNVDLRFVLMVAGIGRRDGIAMYRARLPAYVRYSQRRREFRSRVGAGNPINVTVSRVGSDLGFDAALVDLSVTGFGARCSVHDEVETGDEILVRLPVGGEILELTATLTFSRIDEVQRQRRIGGRFHDLTPDIQRLLSSFVTTMQREYLQRMRSLQAD